jgi:hypothetical protein
VSRRGRRRVRLVLAAALAGWTLLANGSVYAAPPHLTAVPAAEPAAAAGSAGPAALADPGDPGGTDPTVGRQEPENLPVKVTIEQLDPREIKIEPNAKVRVTAVLRNTGTTPTGPLRYRLQRGALITTRSDLAATDKVAPPVTTRFATAGVLANGLAAGQALRVTYECSVDDLHLLGTGVYPLGFVVTETTQDTTVGRAQTLLPSFVGVDPVRTRVAWLWPLLDQPHRQLEDVGGQPLFDTDNLARSVGHGGRLDQLLAAAETVTGRVALTLVIDPETLEELQLMTKGYRYGSTSHSAVGRGQQAATLWLARLRAIAKRQLIVATPYGDPDVNALERGGLSSLAWADDAALAQQILGVPVVSSVVWPPGNALTAQALDDIGKDVNTVLLDNTAVPGGVTGSTPTPSAVSPVPSANGPVTALVTDNELQTVVAHALEFPGGWRLAEQRYLAELAMIGAEAPATPRTLVIAPPRRWTASRLYGTAVLADTARISWLSSANIQTVATTTAPVDRGPLVYPAAAVRTELPHEMVGAIGNIRNGVADFRVAIATAGAANALLTPYDQAVRRAGSSAWQLNPGLGKGFIDHLGRGLQELRDDIGIQKPSSGIYSLASSDSPLTLTVVNKLNAAVNVRVRMVESTPGFRVRDVGTKQIPADSRLTLKLPTDIQRTGTFPVRVQITTPEGGPLGQVINLTVRSTAYGSLALGITGAALVILIGAMIFRMLRRLHGGKAEPAGPAGSPAERSLT